MSRPPSPWRQHLVLNGHSLIYDVMYNRDQTEARKEGRTKSTLNNRPLNVNQRF